MLSFGFESTFFIEESNFGRFGSVFWGATSTFAFCVDSNDLTLDSEAFVFVFSWGLVTDSDDFLVGEIALYVALPFFTRDPLLFPVFLPFFFFVSSFLAFAFLYLNQ